jgi:hypothetical protein
MEPNETRGGQKSEVPYVCIPVFLYHQMALCFYGEGQRHWELVTGKMPQVKDLSPHPPSGWNLKGVQVPTIPPSWRRVTNGSSEVQASEGSAEAVSDT